MSYDKCNNYWMIRVPNFPKERREKLSRMAKEKRQSLSAYIGNLLDAEIQKHEGRPPID